MRSRTILAISLPSRSLDDTVIIVIIMFYALTFFLFLAMIFSLVFLLQPFFSLVPFVPVRKKELSKIISAMELDDRSILYDLGCGDGRVLFAAAEAYPRILCIGVEVAPFPFLLAKAKNMFGISRNVHFLYENFFNTKISSASHVFLYLLPNALDDLLPKLTKELKAGSRVVSCDFKFSKREPSRILEIESAKSQNGRKFYIYDF